MLKKAIVILMLIGLSFYSFGCFSQNFVVGDGAKGRTEVSAKQWFVLWGLVPLNSVDTQDMAGGAADYTINSQQSFVDIIIGAFTGIVTVYPRSVTVTH